MGVTVASRGGWRSTLVTSVHWYTSVNDYSIITNRAEYAPVMMLTRYLVFGCLCAMFVSSPSSGQQACDQSCQIPPRAVTSLGHGCRQDPRSKWGERREGLRYEEVLEERGKQKLPFRYDRPWPIFFESRKLLSSIQHFTRIERHHA